MKRYLGFSGECYYPAGGWDDFKGAFDTLEEAVTGALAFGEGYELWRQVVDTETGYVIYPQAPKPQPTSSAVSACSGSNGKPD